MTSCQQLHVKETQTCMREIIANIGLMNFPNVNQNDDVWIISLTATKNTHMKAGTTQRVLQIERKGTSPRHYFLQGKCFF